MLFSLGAQVDDLLRSPDAADAGPDEARVAEANGVADKAGDKEALVHAEEHELADPALAIEQREVRSVVVERGDVIEEDVELAGVGGYAFTDNARLLTEHQTTGGRIGRSVRINLWLADGTSCPEQSKRGENEERRHAASRPSYVFLSVGV